MGDDHGNAEAVVGRALIEMASMGLPEPPAVGNAAEERDRRVKEIIERKDERRRQMARCRKLQQEPAEQKPKRADCLATATTNPRIIMLTRIVIGSSRLAVEAFRDGILPRLAGLDQRGADPLCDDKGQDRIRAVVAAQEGRCAPFADQARARTSITRGERIRPSTSIASPSLVNSSVTLELLIIGTAVEHKEPYLVSRRTALAAAVEQQRHASSGAWAATAGRRPATAGMLGQGSCCSRRARERYCADSSFIHSMTGASLPTFRLW